MQKRRDGTRERLLSAALRLFTTRGYAETSMDLVAAEADVARTTVFNHFPRKEALLLAALADRRRIVGDRLSATRDTQLDTRERVRDALTHWARSYQTDAATGAALVRAWVQVGGPYLPDATATAHLLSETLALGQQRGDVRTDIDITAAGLVLFDTAIGTLVRWAAPNCPPPPTDLIHTMLRATDLALAGLLGRPGTRSAGE